MADRRRKRETTKTTKDTEPAAPNAEPIVPTPHVVTKRRSLLSRHPVRTAAVFAVVAIAAVMALPQTRYPILGAFIDQSVRLQVIDSQTGKPVSAAHIESGSSGSETETDEEGFATMELPVGNNSITVVKGYYTISSFDIFVGLEGAEVDPFELTATGRQVAVSVENRINGKPLEKVTLKVGEGEVESITDASGKTTLVVPTGSDTLDITLSGSGYNTAEAKLTVIESTEADKANQFTLTPAGKIYFLSKRSGQIDVVKSDLDGKNRKVILKGTGKESDTDTVLLASRDWKYLTLKSKRDGGKYAKLFLIDTSNDSLTLVDQGEANFNPVGWSNQYFIYHVSRESDRRKPGAQRLKSYDASARKITILASSDGEGTPSHHSYQEFYSPTILSNGLIYNSDWYGTSYNKYSGRKAELIFIQPNGQGKKVLLSYSARSTNLGIAPYELDGVYVLVNNYINDTTSYFEYESGDSTPAKAKISSEEYYRPYPTFLVSPNSQQVLWSEKRDGKNTLLVGNESAENEVVIASSSDFTPYGWFTDGYILVSKDSSELYIQTAEKGAKPLKITDYHKPDTEFEGYGYGYGGL
jgi:hypothetical protein